MSLLFGIVRSMHEGSTDRAARAVHLAEQIKTLELRAIEAARSGDTEDVRNHWRSAKYLRGELDELMAELIES